MEKSIFQSINPPREKMKSISKQFKSTKYPTKQDFQKARESENCNGVFNFLNNSNF